MEVALAHSKLFKPVPFTTLRKKVKAHIVLLSEFLERLYAIVRTEIGDEGYPRRICSVRQGRLGQQTRDLRKIFSPDLRSQTGILVDSSAIHVAALKAPAGTVYAVDDGVKVVLRPQRCNQI